MDSSVDEKDDERDQLAHDIITRQRESMFFSPAHFDPTEHGDELVEVIAAVMRERGWLDVNIQKACDLEIVTMVVTCNEVLAARRVQEAMRSGMGLAAFVADGERVPIKKELAAKMERAFLMLADALVAVNRGDLDFLELGQSEKAEVTRVRQIAEDLEAGEVLRKDAMWRLMECFSPEMFPESVIDEGEFNEKSMSTLMYTTGDSRSSCVARFIMAVWRPTGTMDFDIMEAARVLPPCEMNVIRAWLLHSFKL